MKKHRPKKPVDPTTCFVLLMILFLVYSAIILLICGGYPGNVIVKLVIMLLGVAVSAILAFVTFKVIAKIKNWDI